MENRKMTTEQFDLWLDGLERISYELFHHLWVVVSAVEVNDEVEEKLK